MGMSDTTPTKLEHRTKADIEFQQDDEAWDLSKRDYEEELLDAIETASEDGERVIVRPEGPYIMEARPNPKTDSVWVSVYSYALGMEPVDEDGNAVEYEA